MSCPLEHGTEEESSGVEGGLVDLWVFLYCMCRSSVSPLDMFSSRVGYCVGQE